MARPTFTDLLLVQHAASSCAYFRRQYITQSRATQRAGILKGYDVLIPESTFDRCIRRGKERGYVKKQHRSGKLNGSGYVWKSSITYITWKGVMFLWRLHLLPREKFEELKRIFGMLKKRGPAKLEAEPDLSRSRTEGSGASTFPSPT